MSKSPWILDAARQGAIFSLSDLGRKGRIDKRSVPEGSMNLDLQIRELVTESLKETSLSRYQVAGHLSAALGRDVSKSVLDSYSAESKADHKLPAAYVPALAVITGDCAIVRLLCEEIGGAFIPDRVALRMELEHIEGEKRDLRHREQIIKRMLQALSEAADQ